MGFGAQHFSRVLLLMLAAAVLSVPLPVRAQEKPQDKPQDRPVELKLAHPLPRMHPLHRSMEAWAASVEQASGGTIKAHVYPAGELGSANDLYDMVRSGIADLAHANPGDHPERFPIIAASELPFLIVNGKGGSQAVDAWYRTYAAVEMTDVKYCFGLVQEPGALHSRTRKFAMPADIKGRKIARANATLAALVTRLGGTNVELPAAEAREAPERGAVDAIALPWSALAALGLDKTLKHHMDAPLFTSASAWVMNAERYAQLSVAQRKVIDDHCTNQWAARAAEPWADDNAAAQVAIKAEPGHDLYRLSPAQLGEWRSAVEPLEALWADSVRKAGGNPEQILRELKASLAQYQAAF